MGKTALQSKFVPVNLNKSYGQDISRSSSQPSSFGPAIIHKGRPHGGMVLLTRPSSSSLTTQRTQKLGTPPLVNSRKENARNSSGAGLIGTSGSSVWSRQQPPIASRSNGVYLHTNSPAISPDSTLASHLSHMKENNSHISQNVDSKYDPNCGPHKHAKQIAVLREEDFPSLQTHCSSSSRSLHPQQIDRDWHQKQKVQCFGQDQQTKLLRSCQHQMPSYEFGAHLLLQHHLRIHSHLAHPSEATMPIGGTNDEIHSNTVDEHKPGKSAATPNESWADDEREILHQGCVEEEFPSDHDKGLWRLALESDFEFETRVKDCRLVPECLSRAISSSKDRLPLTYNKMDMVFKSNVLDSNYAKDNTWNLDKLRRSLCASGNERCLQGEASGSYLQWILEHRMLGIAKPDFGMESVVGLDLKARRRKKDEAVGAAFKDFARESFEAELEKVQHMLEQERTLVFNGQEKTEKPEEAFKLPDKQQEDKKGFLIEEELQLDLKEDAKNAAESVELELREVAKGALSAREEEKKRMLEEEEKRKERAFKKLLDLEERIARREAEKSLMINARLDSAATNKFEEAAQSELSFSQNCLPMQEQLHKSMVDDSSVTMPYSSKKDFSESSAMPSFVTVGQKVSPSTPYFLQDGDISSALSQVLLERVQVSPPSREKEGLSVDSLFMPLNLKDKDLLVGIQISDDNNGKETPESTNIGVYNSMTDVPHNLHGFEKPQVVVSENRSGGSSPRALKGRTQHKSACKNLISKHSSLIESAGIWLEEEETLKSVESVTADGSSGERRLEMGYADSQKVRVTHVDNVASSNTCKNLKRQSQDVECGEVVFNYSVVKEEFQKPFRNVLPSTIKKANTNLDVHSCYEEIRDELVQQSTPLLHGNQAADQMREDAFNSQQFRVQGLRQPLSMIPICVAKSTSFHMPSNHQQETLFQSPTGLNSAAPFMLHAIQIGSIQMPLANTNSCLPQLPHLHDSQVSLLQFGQLCSTSSNQLLSTVQLSSPAGYVMGQAHEHYEVEAEAYAAQGAKLGEKWDQKCKTKEESPMSSEDRIPCQVASMRASTLQFGQLCSTLLYQTLSRDSSSSCTDEANEKPPQLQVQAQTSCLQNSRAINRIEKCNELLESAEESHVPSSSIQSLQHNNSMAEFGYKDCVGVSERNHANLMGQEGETVHSESSGDFPAVQICPTEKTFPFPSHYNLYFPGRKKKGYATTCTRVFEKRCWRVSTVKTKHVEVSHSILLPGLKDPKKISHGKLNRYVYRKKERSGNDGQQEYQINQQTQTLCSDLPQNRENKKAGSSQTEKAVFMCKNNDTICDLLHRRPLKKQRSVEVIPTEYDAVEQQGIGIIDDFIVVKSRRQILRKQRKEEQVPNAKSKTFRGFVTTMDC